MSFSSGKLADKPILILLAINLLIGLFVFRDYGYSWDEPLFYDYADGDTLIHRVSGSVATSMSATRMVPAEMTTRHGGRPTFYLHANLSIYWKLSDWIKPRPGT
jgi:hypothetical protein